MSYPDMLLESLRFWDEDEFEYKIFSILSIAHPWTSVISAGKSDSRRHSTTSFSENVVVVGTSYQMLDVLSFCYRVSAYSVTSFSIHNRTNFFSEQKK